MIEVATCTLILSLASSGTAVRTNLALASTAARL
jgi:hypothetical protein